jgi:hypothetical protein
MRVAPVNFLMQSAYIHHTIPKVSDIWKVNNTPRMVNVGPWSAMMFNGVPANLSVCHPNGTRDVYAVEQERNVTMHTAFVPSLSGDPGVVVEYDIKSLGLNSGADGWFTSKFKPIHPDYPPGSIVQDGLGLPPRRNKELYVLPTNHSIWHEPVELIFRDEIVSGSFDTALQMGVNVSFKTLNGRFWCMDEISGILSENIAEDVLPDRCKWGGVHTPTSSGMGYLRVNVDHTLIDLKLDNMCKHNLNGEDEDDEEKKAYCSLAFGSSLSMISRDMRARQVFESGYTYEQVSFDAHTSATDVEYLEHVQLSSKRAVTQLGESDYSVFSNKPTMRAEAFPRPVTLSSLPHGMLGEESPRWHQQNALHCGGGEALEVELNAFHAESWGADQSKWPNCYLLMHDSAVLANGETTQFVISTTNTGFAFSIEPSISSDVNTEQIVLDLGSSRLARVSYNPWVKIVEVWLGVHLQDLSKCNVDDMSSVIGTDLVSLWRGDKKLLAPRVVVSKTKALSTPDDYKPCSGCNGTEACLAWEIPQPCSSVVSTDTRKMSLCNGGTQTLPCMNTMRSCHDSQELSQLMEHSHFDGTLRNVFIWDRKIYNSDVLDWLNHASDIYYARSMRFDYEFRSREGGDAPNRTDVNYMSGFAWDLDCRPDILVSLQQINGVALANKYGGVRCVAQSIKDASKEFEFIPVMQCHDTCDKTRPYKCTNGECYSCPEMCEDTEATREKSNMFENWYALTYPDNVWLYGPKQDLPRLSLIDIENRVAAAPNDPSPLKYLQAHTNAATDWLLYPYKTAEGDTMALKLQCDSAGNVRCLKSSGGCASYQPSNTTDFWNFETINVADATKTSKCSKLYEEYPPVDGTNVCDTLSCYPWAPRAARQDFHISDESMCAKSCWVANTQGESYKYYAFISPKKGSNLNSDDAFKPYCFCYDHDIDITNVEYFTKIEDTDSYDFDAVYGKPSLGNSDFWNRQMPCKEIQDVMVQTLNTSTKVNMLFTATRKLVQRAQDEGLPMLMKLANTDLFGDTDSMLLPEINVNYPDKKQLYRSAASDGWTVSIVIDPSQDNQITPMSVGTMTSVSTNNFRRMDHGADCHVFRRYDSTNRGYNPENFRLCNDGSIITQFHACSASRAGTVLCPKSTPIKCREKTSLLTTYSAVALRMQVHKLDFNQVRQMAFISLSEDNVRFSVREANIHSGNNGETTTRTTIVTMQILDQSNIDMLRMATNKSISGANLSHIELGGNHPNDDLWTSKSLHFKQTTVSHADAKTWRRVFQSSQIDQADGFVLSDPNSAPMIIHLCDPGDAGFSSQAWIVVYGDHTGLTSNSGPSNCDNFLMRIPEGLGVMQTDDESLPSSSASASFIAPEATPFPVSEDWRCVAERSECLTDKAFMCSQDDMSEFEINTMTTSVGIDYMGNVGFNMSSQTQVDMTSPICVKHQHPYYSHLPDLSYDTLGLEDFQSIKLKSPETQTTGDMTLMLDVKPDGDPPFRDVFLYHKNYAGEGALVLTPGMKVYFKCGSSHTYHPDSYTTNSTSLALNQAQVNCTSTTLPLGEHTKITVIRGIWDGVRGIKCYNNGTLVEHSITDTCQSPGVSDANHMTFGMAVQDVLGISETPLIPTFFNGTLKDVLLYNLALPQTATDNLHAGISPFPLEGVYNMPWGNKGENKLVQLRRTSTGTVEWNHCEANVYSQTTCEAGMYSNNSIIFNYGEIQEYKVSPTIAGGLILPTNDNDDLVLTRMHHVALEACDFSDSAFMMRCVGVCDGTPDSPFKIKMLTMSDVSGLQPYCLTFAYSKLYFSPCRHVTGVANDVQSFVMQNFNSETASVQLRSHNEDDEGNVCVYVRHLHGLDYLALDYTCTMWTSMRFLRKGILVDSDDPRVKADAIVDTLHSVYKPVVTYSVSNTGGHNIAKGMQAISANGVPSSYFQPILSIGDTTTNLTNMDPMVFRYGVTDFSFAANRIEPSDDISMVPAQGLLVGRNWQVVKNKNENKPGHISQQPSAQWKTIVPANTGMVKISDGSALLSFNTDTESSCKRRCELNAECASITWYETPKLCAFGKERGIIDQFDVTAVFSAYRDNTIREVIDGASTTSQQTSSFLSRMYDGYLDTNTNLPSKQLQSLIVSPSKDIDTCCGLEYCCQDEFGYALQPMGIDTTSGEITSLQVIKNSFYQANTLYRFNLTIRMPPSQFHWSTEWSACQGAINNTQIIGTEINLPAECDHQLFQSNVTYLFYATRGGEDMLLFPTRFVHLTSQPQDTQYSQNIQDVTRPLQLLNPRGVLHYGANTSVVHSVDHSELTRIEDMHTIILNQVVSPHV